MTTYSARRIASRLYEYVNEDGTPDITGSEETFNYSGWSHCADDETHEFETVSDLVAAVRRDYVTFDATGSDWATDPDGSQIIDYATGERETVSWHFDTIKPELLARVIIPAVDAR